MKKKKETIVQAHGQNFETLKKAFQEGNVCSMECTLKETGEKVAVICAVGFDGTEYNMTPFAMFFNGNPYEMLVPPMVEVPA